MHVKYNTKGTCAVRIEFDVEDGVVKNIAFLGGCDGNHKGIAALVEEDLVLFFMRRRRSFFCVLRKFSADRILSKQHIIRDGGENLENKNYLGLHRVQTEKLQHNKGQKSYA